MFALFSTCVASAGTAHYVPLNSGPQVQTFLGGTTVKFVGINPIRYSAQPLAVNVTTTNAPAPAFIPSVGGAAKPAPNVSTSSVGPPPCPATTLDDVIATTSAFIGQSALDADASAPSDADIRAALKDASLPDPSIAYANAINIDPNFRFASACLTLLSGMDLTKATTDEKNAVSALRSAYPFLLGGTGVPAPGVAVADVEKQTTVSCKGLLGGSLTATVTETLAPRTAQAGQTANNQVSTITVKCLGQVAVSAGFAFSSLSQTTFNALPTNTGTSTAPTIATIQEATTSSIHAIPFAFVHVAPSPDCNAQESCTFITFGAGVTSSSNSAANNIDFALGVTQSFSRYMFVTAGANLGQDTVLANGYTLGGPIAVGTAIPTVTRQRVGYFIGVSFGSRP